MKHRFLLAGAFAVMLGTVNAQVQRTCMAEAFSNASCGPCASQNPGYNSLLGTNTSKVIAVKYQTNWPGVDPMNAQTQSEVGVRVTYYSVTGVPYGRLDGTEFAGSAYAGALANLDQTEIDTRYAVTSPFAVTVNPVMSSNNDSVLVDVTVSTPATFSGTSLKLHVLLAEELISFSSAPGTNGETQFHNVFRKFFSGTSGYTLPSSWGAAESHTYSFGIPLPAYIYSLSEMRVIAFIQTDATKEVYQAAKAPVTVLNYGKTENLAGFTPLNCTNSASGITVSFKNDGSNTITSATISYQLDGGTVNTIPYSGSLAGGASTPINIPALTGLSSGSHTLSTWASNINGSGSTTPLGTVSKSFNIFTGAASATPLVQNFSVSTFPYANWTLDNPNASETWARVSANTGSMKFNNFSFAAGATSGMIVEPVDMTAASSATMTFDVAYRQYSSESDQLEVFVSTNCGATWTSVYNKSGSTLSTLAASTTAFTPTAANQWRNESVDLSAYSSATQLFVKFQATSDYGNNLYVDNINIGSASTSSVEDNNNQYLTIYPNPASDFINVNLVNAENVTISLINAMGQVVKVYNNVNTNATLSLEGLASGMYVIAANINGQIITKQIIKK